MGATLFGQPEPRLQMGSPSLKTGQRLQRTARLQIDGDLFGLVIERTAVNDLDVQPRQTRCAVVRVVLTRFSPWTLMG
jgi:hypothetical protein